jgi:hypothetical protein
MRAPNPSAPALEPVSVEEHVSRIHGTNWADTVDNAGALHCRLDQYSEPKCHFAVVPFRSGHEAPAIDPESASSAA